MKSLSVISLGVVLAMAAGCGSNPASPTTDPLPTSFTFTASLLPANETPAVTNADASGSGTATITMNVTRDGAGSITAATATFDVSLSGFPAGTVLTAAHIHQGGPGVAAGVLLSTGLASGEVTLPNGSGSFQKAGVNVPVDVANNLIAGASGFYFNVHTTINPTGAVRGQLAKQ